MKPDDFMSLSLIGLKNIRETPTPDNWIYVNTKENPADETLCGLTPMNLLKICSGSLDHPSRGSEG